MFRSILRTSRWLVRKQINNFTPIVAKQVPVNPVSKNSNTLFIVRKFSATSQPTDQIIEQAVFEEICNETLESLCECFEELVEQAPNLKGADVTYSDGVLTVSLGSSYGTYVINRQTPNKQIWLSSPLSGPKRYDLVLKNGGYWLYKHDGVTLHKLLQEELSKIVENEIDFKKCSHSLI
ncbi:hypothetical protein K1T71_005439 [Dendrolimus kikuchii]|uniref:Uncharacterized protein n=1 Tax=Dendrolimus kikuchii TaxID=765133 RepID=A0ACC1D413_9NEOP|nr:hypothetical protein K1T71_005439 [Dendrolimus kikuchii]